MATFRLPQNNIVRPTLRFDPQMVNEHYVPESYLRLFAPDGEGLISRYSLVDKHAGGDYLPPFDQYSVKKAASEESYADGWLEGPKTTRIEEAIIQSIRRLRSGDRLEEKDVAHLSQFIALQQDRSPESKLHFEGLQLLRSTFEDFTEVLDIDLTQSWDSVLYENVKDGHETLQYMGWLLVENDTPTPFVTSDQPVTSYFEVDREEIEADGFHLEHREMFCPIGPEYCLVLLDPSRFAVDAQFPDTELQRVQLEDEREVHKLNLLQVVTAFQEVFGPVGEGDYLEALAEALSKAFPDEDFVRGNKADLETIERSLRISAGQFETEADFEWYREEGGALTKARRLKGAAVWNFSHSLSFIDERRKEDPSEEYWTKLM